jgi:hypothetical protein|tara:strand:- start:1127 stop:1582 length:456 start_codon:yes stop_codon:yes gene_type:complete
MNVVIKEEQFKISNIYYTEPIQNIIMDNSQFIKIVYSNQDIMMSGIFLLVELKHITKESYFKKIKITYDTSLNKNILNRIYEIENQLLQKYNIHKKIQRKIIYDTLNNGVIKLFPNNENDLINNNNSFILKISGIWENDTEYGLTYKLLCI